MHADLVATHKMLDSFIGCKIDGVGGACTNNNTGHASPETQYALACGHLVGALYHAIVDRGRIWIEDLHSRLRNVGGCMSGRDLAKIDDKPRLEKGGGGGWVAKSGQTNLDSINWVHNSVFLLRESEKEGDFGCRGRGRERCTDSYSCKGAGCHVLQEGEVGREGFIATVIESRVSSAQPNEVLVNVAKELNSLVVLVGLGIGLGHWGRSGRCFAESLLEIQIGDGNGVEGPFVGARRICNKTNRTESRATSWR